MHTQTQNTPRHRSPVCVVVVDVEKHTKSTHKHAHSTRLKVNSISIIWKSHFTELEMIYFLPWYELPSSSALEVPTLPYLIPFQR